VVCVLPNALSDVLFCLPALAALRESFPGAHLSAVARGGLAPLVRAAHLVDEVLERPRGGLSAQANLLLKLHAHKPDIAVAFSSGRNAALLAWSSGAPVRAGFEESKMEALFNHRQKRNGPARIEAFLELARSLGCKTPHLDYCGLLELPPVALRQSQDLLDECGLRGGFIVVAPSSPDTPSARSKRKSSGGDLWVSLLPALSDLRPVVLLGSAPSPRLVRAGGSRPIFDLGGRADLLTMAALCLHSELMVGAQGGLLHLASAMKTPVLGLYDAEAPSHALPRGPRRIVRLEKLDKTAPDSSQVLEEVLTAVRESIGL
jgi:ADP-heptose:LPS heptosyltransferase